MSFFRRKNEPQIPLPPSRLQASSDSNPNRSRGPSPGPPPSYRSNANTYNYSRDGPDPYAPPESANNFYGDDKSQSDSYAGEGRDRYSRNTGIGDPYSRGGGNFDADRSELFAGYNPEKAGGRGGRNRFDDRSTNAGRGGSWQDRTPANQEEEEEDVETIKKDIRSVKNDSLASTRNALRLAREAEETGRATLMKLGDQSEKIANTERHLDSSKAATSRAEDRTGEIKQLNRSIFRPVIVFNKEGKRQKQEARLAERHAQEREERERAQMDFRESQNRIGRAATYGRDDDQDPYGAEPNSKTEAQRRAQKAGRGRFQFEATASDDELEDELDDNLNEIHDVTKKLRALATAQGEELTTQNQRLDRLNNNATKLDDKLVRATDRRRPTAPIPTLASRAASALRASSTLQSTPERLPGSSNILSTTAPTSTVKPSLGNLTGRSFSGGGLPSGGINSSGLPSRPAKTIAAPALKAAQRTTKTSQKLVVLPSEVQTAPLPLELQSRAVSDDDSTMGPPTVRFPPKHHEHRSEGERMTKAERQRAGYRRLAAYCIAEGFRMKLLLAYLKREHGVAPRVFDEAIYALYHLPLLPGYGPNVNIRSSAAPRSPEGGSILSQLSDVEDLGYDGTYFATPSSPEQYSLLDGYISGSPPVPRTQRGRPATADAGATDTAVEFETDVEPTSSSPSTSPVAPFTPIASNAPPPQPTRKPTSRSTRSQKAREEDRIAEIIVFDYGVVVFFGFEEGQERDVLEDFERALISVRPRAESNWEIEHCHYV
ncbi:Protein transport protein S9 plasma membrane t-SNARE, partial [Tulasnella sp. 403]